MPSSKAPKTLLEAVRYFADEDAALEFAANVRWPEGEQVCPKCGSIGQHYFLKNQRRWKCRDCRKQFSFKVGTIFEDSPLPMSKWLPAVWMLANCKNGISSYEMGRALGVTQKTAWFMLHRIREAMREGTFEKLGGEVEADEAYFGGAMQNMHESKKRRLKFERTQLHRTKAMVVGTLQRSAEPGTSVVRTSILPSASHEGMRAIVRSHVEAGSQLYTDQHAAYSPLSAEYAHQWVSHAIKYVEGRVHTNGLENFWSLVKRTIKGTYVSVDPFHLFRYLDEQSFRFNERGDNDGGRFVAVLRRVIGRRLTYSRLTGANLPT